MAVGLLEETNQLKAKELQNYGFIGELSLNAGLRPCIGVSNRQIKRIYINMTDDIFVGRDDNIENFYNKVIINVNQIEKHIT